VAEACQLEADIGAIETEATRRCELLIKEQLLRTFRAWRLVEVDVDACQIKNQFRTQLNRAGVTNAPGFLFGSLHGEFKPSSRESLIRGYSGLRKEVPASRQTIWREIRAGRFPAPIELGPNSLGWFKAEIEAGKASRPRRKYGSRADTSDASWKPTRRS
jgi:predicted DNA-binding transcriptional regulator AlpA